MHYKVKEVARMVGTTVRLLHYYDEIGLLKPDAISAAGYRFYSERNLDRLQQILFFKELDFSLQEIKEALDNPAFDKRRTLAAHRELLLAKKRRLERIIATVDRTLQGMKGDSIMSPEEMFEGFDMTEIERHKAQYAEETRQKYGHTDAYRESERRTAAYKKADWARITARAGAIYQRIAERMDKGPADPEVQQAVADYRQHITDSFYNCTPEIFRGLGELYVADARFTQNIDKTAPGLAAFLKEAIAIYCDRLETR